MPIIIITPATGAANRFESIDTIDTLLKFIIVMGKTPICAEMVVDNTPKQHQVYIWIQVLI